ncbi:MAG: hypothetical protein QOG90_2463 [Actinomycetota bacterium]|jgi:hypothetical protein
MKAKAAVVGLGVLMSTAGFGAMTHAQASIINIPAPPSAANAVAVKVGNLVSVGQSGAGATQGGATASAAPISIAGTPILAGTKVTNKSGSGAAFDTGKTQLGQVAVLPWATDVASDHSSSSSAVATAGLNGVGDVAVAPSFSFASWTPGKSNSSAVSDGAVLHLGDYTIKVLHSESSASGYGKTYLVQLFGHEIGTTNASGCMLDIGPLANLGCLKALNGVGSNATVAQALIGSKAPFGKVIAAAATGGAGQAGLSSAVKGTELTRAPSNSLLARTGTSALLMIALGMLLIAGGMVARFGGREVAVLPARP